MEFRDLVEKRASVRQFRADPVDPQDLREMVRLAILAPSPNNSQPWQFVAVTRRSTLGDMAAAVRQRLDALLPVAASDEARRARQRVEWSSTFFEDAPAVIAVALTPYEAVVQRVLGESVDGASQINALRGQPDVESVGAAIEHLLLAATDLGYGACWLSGPVVAREALERMLGIAPPNRLAAMVAVGRPVEAPGHRLERRSVEELLRFID